MEIDCPPTCGYLAVATSHPPAAVRRQQEYDLAFLMPVLNGLSDSQSELLSVLFSVLARYRGEGFAAPRDADVLDGLSALLATHETARRGVIYEHRPDTLPGQRIATELGAMFAEEARKAGRAVDDDALLVLGRAKQLAESVRKASPDSGTSFLELLRRAVAAGSPGTAREHAARHPLILP